ncbi:MAG TPA: CopD family protein [Pseudolabrys sp.]|nr:CopD family protein [Pseudolabrys sp.]
MIAWTKAVHIAALIVWCAGLLVLPSIYGRRSSVHGPDLHELHRFARAVFIRVTSPAAFLTVIAGITLIFLREVFTAWMALKLVAVGALVVIHMRQGHVLLSLFEPGRDYALWRTTATILATTSAIGAILWLVLAKPPIDTARLPDRLLTPGGLQSLLETMMPMP